MATGLPYLQEDNAKPHLKELFLGQIAHSEDITKVSQIKGTVELMISLA